MPLTAADEDRLEALRPIAADLQRSSPVKIRLVRFDSMVELGEVEE